MLRLILLLATISVALASSRVLYSTAPVKISEWQLGDADPNHAIPITFGLHSEKQAEIDRLFEDVTDPLSPKYGQYLSFDQFTKLTSASTESIQEVLSWLNSHGITEYTMTPTGNFLKFSASSSVLEQAFDTKIVSYTHQRTGRVVHRARDHYSLPAHIARHVGYVAGLSRLPRTHTAAAADTINSNVKVVGGDSQISLTITITCPNGQPTADPTNPCSDQEAGITLQSFSVALTPLGYPSIGPLGVLYVPGMCSGTSVVRCSVNVPAPVPNYVPLNLTKVSAVFSSGSVNQGAPVMGFAGKWVTPQVLAQAYNVPPGTFGTHPNSSQAVAEFLDEYYAPSDLTEFFRQMSLPNTPVAKVVGPNDPTRPGGEATLDIEYLMALALNISTEFWSTPGGSPSGEPYADWLAQMASTPHIPWVHSISYGDVELQWDENDAQFVCTQFQHAGLRGVSLIFSSGDDGVANFEARTNASYCHPFHPAFPATCPYVTVVGGTQFSTFTSPVCYQSFSGMRLNCDIVGEIAADAATGSVITTGGGFSDYFPRPEYQTQHVSAFLDLANKTHRLPPSSYFHVNGRAYPDVSAMAHNYLIVMNNELSPIHGTSASAPTFAALVALLNDARFNTHQPPMGFLNPWLYTVAQQHPEAFNDIVMGDNKCTAIGGTCCEYGFHAQLGWDPVTGLGTPNFGVLRNIVLNPNILYPTAVSDGPQASAPNPWLPTVPVWIVLGAAIVLLVYSTVQVFALRRKTGEGRPLLGTA